MYTVASFNPNIYDSSASVQIIRYNYFKNDYCIKDSILSLFPLRRTRFSQVVETIIFICGTWSQEHVR